MKKRYLGYLRRSSMFKGFEDKEIETFLKGVEHSFVELRANEKYELKMNKYVVVLSGMLISYVTNKKGRIDTIQGFHPSYNAFLFNAVADDSKIVWTDIFTPNVQAKKDTLLLEMDSSKFTSYTAKHTELQYRFQLNAIQMHSATMLQRDLRAWCAISSSARESVMRFLLYMYRMHQSERLRISITRDEVASFLLIDTSTLMRELRKIRKDGIIDYKGKNITILKPEELTKFSETDNSEIDIALG